jgi:uncharacterized protein
VMPALYDVNMLIALFDAHHIRHRDAFAWHRKHGASGWASCPITQNGFIRIMSHAKYANPQPVFSLVAAVARFSDSPEHTFWQDSLSLGVSALLNPNYPLTSGKLPDAYLLALALKNTGRLVTLDQHISTELIIGATKSNLVVL